MNMFSSSSAAGGMRGSQKDDKKKKKSSKAEPSSSSGASSSGKKASTSRELLIDINDARDKMKKHLDKYMNDLSQIRVGRADPSMLDKLMVNAHGKMVSLPTVAQVSAKSSKLLVVTVFDEALVREVEQSILKSSLNLVPMQSDKKGVLNVPIPLTTKEVCDSQIKLAKASLEKTKQQIQHIRRDLMSGLQKKSGVAEDDKAATKSAIEDLTNEFVKATTDQFQKKSDELTKSTAN